MTKFQEPVTFEDFPVDFTGEEWSHLPVTQRQLHRAGMLESYCQLVSAGDLNEDSVKTLQEKGLRDLPHKELSCWLI
nr:zinc finger protein 2 [Desmodus rotundus]XP_045051972.2 zinc finger protein 2 [Desmodus rotundus]XP_045051973.2 zinc finger protein 2 [Desmodus rotundus]